MWVQDNRYIVYNSKKRQWTLLIRNISNPALGRIVDLNTQNTQRAKELAGGGEWLWLKDN